MTPAERSLRARMAAYSLHAQRDARETTSAARAAFLGRFEQQVDPGGQLLPEERARRAHAARKAYFTKLALASSKARRRPMAADKTADKGDVWEGFTGRLF